MPDGAAGEPDGGLVGPRNGDDSRSASSTAAASSTYTFNPGSGNTLDTASINGDEFTITSTGSCVSLDPTQTPVLVSGTTYRYWTRGPFQSGDVVTLNFAADRWAWYDSSGGHVGNTASSTAAANSATAGRHYIDVTLVPQGSVNTVDETTLNGSEISISGVTFLTSADAKPTKVAPNTYRYYFANNFTSTGPVTVTFAALQWSDSGGNQNVASTGTFTIVAPSSTVSGPFDDDEIDVNTANGAVTAPPSPPRWWAPPTAAARCPGGSSTPSASSRRVDRSATRRHVLADHRQRPERSTLTNIPVGPAGTTSRNLYRKSGRARSRWSRPLRQTRRRPSSTRRVRRAARPPAPRRSTST